MHNKDHNRSLQLLSWTKNHDIQIYISNTSHFAELYEIDKVINEGFGRHIMNAEFIIGYTKF